uniref:Reverse transcriptase Ty1/copia-type domain-containing protein n=1 Tax=Solanum lycopersicum TaxID=4081 RepID=A0A3Q7I0B8_SOLLC
MGYGASKSDTSLFIYIENDVTIYIMLNVDDIIIMRSHTSFLDSIISKLGSEFSIRDLGPLSYFRGVQVSTGPDGLHATVLTFSNPYGSEYKASYRGQPTIF